MSQTAAQRDARYAVNAAKVVEAIVWLAWAKPGIDVHRLATAAFLADKHHLNRHGRPLVGDDYDADTYGPLGRCLYGLLRRDPVAMVAFGGNGALPFRVRDDAGWTVEAEREANLRVLSASDIESLRFALDAGGGASFDALVESAHTEPAFVAARGGRLRYEDMLDPEDPERDRKAADLALVADTAIF